MSIKVVEVPVKKVTPEPSYSHNPNKDEIEELRTSAQKTEKATTRVIASSTPKQNIEKQVIYVQKNPADKNPSSCSNRCSLIAGVVIGALAVTTYYGLQWFNRAVAEMDIPT